ncbi:universal stress protein [Albibacterium indicum]|uniref:universal stress protein n=1 Tax=Albibacterium indicum TaxID=2292082 RepID=UPI000E476F32|nr:universal stress protein [Pedobacter indicus]
MKTLIAATDFSKEADNAVEYACFAAATLGTDVVLFNAYHIPLHVSNARLSAKVFKELMDNNKLLLEKKAAELSKKYSIKVDYETRFSQLDEEIESIFLKYDAQMVIMGTAPDSLGQELFGNTTTTLIMQHDLPVLAVPPNVKFKAVRKILFAVDFLRGINVRILENVREYARAAAAEVEVFHVQRKLKAIDEEHRKTTTKEIDSSLGDVPHYYKSIESDKVIEAIKNEAKRMEADLLIMVPQRYGFWESIIHRSKTRIMASQTEIPLLSIPVNKAKRP